MSTENETPFEKFKKLYDEAKNQVEQLPRTILEMLNHFEEMNKTNTDLKGRVKEIEEKFTTMQKEYETKQSSVTEMETELNDYKSQLQKVEEQMEGFRNMYEEMAQEQSKELDLQELMAIYSILFEQVFAANPHTKVMLLLQGTNKEIWTRNEITMTTGYSPAAILKTLHDLRNNGIIEMDESSNEIKLLRRIV